MKKILLLAVASSLWFSQAHALEDYGFYIGLEGIATRWTFESDTNFNAAFSSYNTVYYDHGWDYSALGRLATYIRWGSSNRVYSSLEIFAEPHDIYFINTYQGPPFLGGEVDFLQKTEATYTFGAQLKQGYFIKDELLAFLTTGFVLTQFKTLTNFSSLTNSAQSFFASNEDRFYLPAFRLGTGLEYFAMNNLSLDAQISYTWYSDKNLSITNQNPNDSPVPKGKMGELQFSPDSLQMGVGLNFYF